MTEQDFNFQMNRLATQFGRTAYGADRTQMIWQLVKTHDVALFRRIVDGFISSSRQAPLLPDFQDLINQEREREWSKTKQEPIAERDWNFIPRCDYCTDLGVYLCSNKNHSGVWAFRCHCERGMNDPRKAIPQFKPAHISQGFEYFDYGKRREQLDAAVEIHYSESI